MIRKSILTFHYPFKNLVFQGGGVRSYVYHGALRVLEEKGILDQIERVAGTSAGALFSTLISFRLSAEETIKLYKTIDFSKMKSEPLNNDLKEKQTKLIDIPLQKLRINMVNLNRIINKYGLYSSHYAYHWMLDIIAEKCQGNGRATFGDFRQLGFRDLYITAVNISRQRLEVFSAKDTPQVSVADAVLMSGTIPMFFEALQFDGHSFGKGDYYVDGGLLSNLPIHIFDDPKFKKSSKHFTFGINWETLGFRQYTPKDCPGRTSKISNLLGYAEAVFESMTEVQNVGIEQRGVDQHRSIKISNCCVSPVDFNLIPDDADLKYSEMVQSGENATREYLENYKLPTDHFADIKEKFSEFFEIWS